MTASLSPWALGLALTLASTASLRAQNVVQEWSVQGAQAPFVGGVLQHPQTDHVWATDARNYALIEYSRSGLEVSRTATLPLNPSPFHAIVGLAVDAVSGLLYLADESEDIIEFDPFTRQVVRVFSVRGFCSDLSGITCDPLRRELYLVNDSTSEMIACSLSGTYQRRFSLLSFGIVDPDGLAYVPWGNSGFGSLLIGDDQLDTLFEVSLDGARLLSTTRVFHAGQPISPEGLEVDPASGTLFVCDGDQAGRVYEIAGLFGRCSGGTWVYGSACRDDGGGAPALRVSFGGAARPCARPGILMLLEATTTSSATHAGLIVGTSSQNHLGIPLPLDLSPLGGSGCALLDSAEVILTPTLLPLATRGTTQIATLPVLVPNLPALSGRSIYLQSFFGPDSLRPMHPVTWSHGLRIQFE